jgi:secreted trypsin-like serine protease
MHIASAGVSLAIFACNSPTGTTGQPITNGTPDDGDEAVVAFTDNGFAWCTGTLIAPDLVLTAAHCVASRQERLLAGGATIFFGADPLVGGEHRRAIDVVLPDTYDPATLASDIGLVRLGAPAPERVEPVPLLQAGSGVALAGSQVRIIGFGVRSADEYVPAGKTTGTATVAGIDDDIMVIESSPSQTCFGDSGGPALIHVGDFEVLAGIASRGTRDCAELAIHVRADAYAADFIIPQLEASRGGCAVVTDSGPIACVLLLWVVPVMRRLRQRVTKRQSKGVET